MFDPKILNDLTKQFIDNLPPAFKNMHQELEKTVRTAMGSIFAKMDLVSREEFDAQVALLAENKAKLESMQTELTILSEKLADVELRK